MTMEDNDKKREILSREDIYECGELEKEIDIDFETFPLVDLMKVCIDFILNRILAKENIQKLSIDRETEMKAKRFMLQAKAYFCERTITKEALLEERLSCWSAHRESAHESAQRNLYRLIVCFLFDEETSEENAECRQDSELFIIFHCLYELGSGYCKQFRLYLQKEFNSIK